MLLSHDNETASIETKSTLRKTEQWLRLSVVCPAFVCISLSLFADLSRA